MKYLLVTALILAVFWLWRHKRQAGENPAPPAQPRPADKRATEIVACDICHVHLPKSDALIGSKGFYCSDAHRRQAEAG